MPWHNSIKVVVTFATSGSEVACFELDPSQTAQDIQQELYRITGAPGYRQRLLFENEVLEPQRRLQDLGFARELSLLLIVQDVFQLATTSLEGGVKLWDTNTGDALRTWGGSSVRQACFSADGCSLLIAGNDSTAKILNTLTGETVETFRGHDDALYSAVFSPDGSQILTASYDGTAKLWYVLTAECVKTFTGHQDGVVCVAFGRENQVLSASMDCSAKVWDLDTAQCLQTLQRPRGEVVVSAFSTEDGNLALSTMQDGTAKLWNIATAQCVHTCKGHRSYITSARLSLDGSLLVTASFDRTARLWQPRKRFHKSTRCFQGHQNGVASVEFSGDLKHIVTAASDGCAKIWNLETGECIKTVKGNGSMNHATFSPT